MSAAASSVRLLVCGSIDRQDDGVAVRAAELLLSQQPELSDTVDVAYCGQLDIDDVTETPPGMRLVVADAAVGPVAGAIVRRTLDELGAGTDAVPHSSHALPIGHVLGIAAELRRAPVEGIFVGVGGASFGFGHELSPVVLEALPEFAAALLQAVSDQSSPRLPGAGSA